MKRILQTTTDTDTDEGWDQQNVDTVLEVPEGLTGGAATEWIVATTVETIRNAATATVHYAGHHETGGWYFGGCYFLDVHVHSDPETQVKMWPVNSSHIVGRPIEDDEYTEEESREIHRRLTSPEPAAPAVETPEGVRPT